MNYRFFISFVLLTFLVVSISSAHGDKKAQSNNKTEHACCSDKSGAKEAESSAEVKSTLMACCSNRAEGNGTKENVTCCESNGQSNAKASTKPKMSDKTPESK